MQNTQASEPTTIKSAATPKEGVQTNRKPKTRKVGKAAATTSKTQTLLSLLRRKTGASLDELMTASSWQAHSVRGFLSGTVKKKLGLELGADTNAKGLRRYRIVDERAA